MSWRIEGTYWAPCSCKVGCPCALGEMEGDNGWCSGVFVIDIKSGNADGADVGGVRLVMAADWPSGFLAGNGTGRLYFDPAASQQQREALAPIVQGKKGGVLEAIGSLVPKFLPSKEAPINIRRGEDATRVSVGSFGELVSKPLRGPSGEVTRLLHAAAAFRDEIVLADGRGSRWQDPDLRQWESGGHSEQADFDWSG